MGHDSRVSGTDITKDIFWGTHFCQLYQTKEDLVDTLVSYFKAGLENNEFCLWITSQLLDIEEAKEALRKVVPDIDTCLEKGQIEFISCMSWYSENGILNSEKVLNVWIEKLNQALIKGYDGVRLTEDVSWLKKENWNDLDNYNKEIDRIIGNYHITYLCTYSLDRLSATEVIDVVSKHKFALIKRDGKWEQIENSRWRKAEYNTQILADIMELSDDAIITESLDGTITSWSRGAERIYGYSAKEILGKSVSILDPPILVEEVKELTELVKQEDRIHHYETLQLRKNGKIIDVSLTLSPIFEDSGNPMAVLIIAKDLSKSKRSKERFQKSEEIYRVVTQQTGQLIYDYDLITDKCSWVGAIEEVTGYKFEEFQKLGKYVWSTNIESLNGNFVDVKHQNIRETTNRFKEELRLRRKDGTYIYIENKGIYLTDNEGRPYEAIGVIKDITDWKLAIKKVEESEEKYRSFAQNFQGIIYQRDENFVPMFLHGAVEEITGYTERELITRIKWKDLIYEDDLPLVFKEEEKVHKFPSTGYGNIEYRIRHRDGRIRWIHEIFQKIKETDQKSEFYQGTIYDVTEKKETEKTLQNIETARKKEIHHRIKNNLQVISSLLDLQAEKFQDKECIKDSEILEAFGESQNRVLSMSLIHEELYKGKGTDTLNFSEYIKNLAKNLLQTYSLRSENVHLNMDLEENAFFDMDIAVPLGIIVNELFSNSLKYAFNEGEKGEIQIRLCRQEKNNETHKSLFNLTISDNGKGISENVEFENVESLGLQLVSLLVDQLDGEIKLNRDCGTEFVITFKVTEDL
ncbi:Sensory transduction histidine kinase [Methanosarcina barkeri 3]|uniref:Sensory transduction histidine kinase n=1 Tax=Methanosarcina barkeri 3 TaxID=1434107 RepID=A0A0E3SNZ1_METBA|nr:PAS domain S-box protein [Methanosarcina barkeri]AKB83163.1 Sensory transduction histidine kinase [Methanosarcina barkeri 3]